MESCGVNVEICGNMWKKVEHIIGSVMKLKDTYCS